MKAIITIVLSVLSLITITIFCMTFFVGCASLPTKPEPLNITAEEMAVLEPLYCSQQDFYSFLCFYKHEKAYAAAVVHESLTLLRYCYLDQGELVGFVLDRDKNEYVPEVVREESVAWLTEALENMAKGLTPFGDEPELEEEEEEEEEESGFFELQET